MEKKNIFLLGGFGPTVEHGAELLVVIVGVGEQPLDVLLRQLLLLHRHILRTDKKYK